MHFTLESPRRRPLRNIIGGDPVSRETERTDDEIVATPRPEAARPPPPVAPNAKPPPPSPRDEGYQQGYREGLESGHQEGFEQGRSEGLAVGERAMREHLERQQAQLETVLQAITAPLTTLKTDLAEAVADGALRLARLLVRGVLEADPQALTTVVGNILDEAAEAGGPHHQLRIHVPPDALDAVSAIAESYGAQVIVDQQLNPGDVSATLVKNNGDPVHQIEWDARLETRWKAIRAALGLRPL